MTRHSHPVNSPICLGRPDLLTCLGHARTADSLKARASHSLFPCPCSPPLVIQITVSPIPPFTGRNRMKAIDMTVFYLHAKVPFSPNPVQSNHQN